MRTILNLANLGSLSGGAAQAIIDAALARAVADFDDRGDDCKPRVALIKVTIQKALPSQEQAKVEVEARVQVRVRICGENERRKVMESRRVASSSRHTTPVIFLLRTIFCNWLPSDLLHLVRQLQFRTAEQSSGKITHGKESIGRAVLSDRDYHGRDCS